MAENEVTLSRGMEVLNRPVQTSLTAFMESKTQESTPDDTSDSTEVTESESEQSVRELVQESEQADDTPAPEGDVPDAGTDDIEAKEFEVKGSKVKLKDLINSYETREEISRRFSEVGRKEAKIKAEAERNKKEREELDFINEKFEEARELIFQGNSIGALQVLLSIAPSADNSDTPKTMQELIEQAVVIANNFHNMSEEERSLFFQKEELESKRRKLEKKEKREKAKEQEQELLNYYNTVLDANKIEDAEIQQAVEDISKYPQHAAEYDKKQDPKDRINYCASWILGKRLTSRVKEGIAKVRPDLKENNDFLLAILNEVDANCTVEDAEAITREYVKLTSKNSSEVKAEASKKDVAKATTPNRVPTEKTEAENKYRPGMSLAELAELYSKS